MKQLQIQSASEDIHFNDNLEHWMSELPNAIRCLPLINLAIPGKKNNCAYCLDKSIHLILPQITGSHDSMSFGITKNAAVAPDAEPAIRNVYKVAPCIVRRWAITQQLNAAQQLAVGVRYFDLRFSLIRTSNWTQFHFVHGLFADVVRKPFLDMLAFLDQNPREFIVFDCQHFYDFTRKDYKYLCDEIRLIFGDRLFGRMDGPLEELSLDMAERMNKQVWVNIIVLYSSCLLNYFL